MLPQDSDARLRLVIAGTLLLAIAAVTFATAVTVQAAGRDRVTPAVSAYQR